MLGQLVQTETPKTKEATINIAALSNGHYIFKIETDTTFSTMKILKRN